MLTASRERGVIGCREIDAQHPEDRGQEALGLTQRSVEEETERQGGFDGEIGILELPAPPADASRCPRGDRVRREPEGDVASPHEGSVVLDPVPDAIRSLVLRMHSRLHIEIMTRLRSRWSTCRPLLAHRAESAHKRREWAAVKHGGRGRRGWKKLHLGVDRSGVIVARALTAASVDDATTGITLIEAVDGALGRVTADAAYDTVGFYEAAGARGATVVVPPTSTANVSRRGPRSRARDHTILAVKERGRRRWKQMSGYHGQARVENAFFRYKSIIGDSLRACSPGGRGTEVVLACNILNQMTGLGRPMSYRIGR